MKNYKGIVVILITLCLVFALVACSNGSFDPTKANGGNEEGGGNGGGNGGEGGGEEGIQVNTTNPLTLEATVASTITIHLNKGSIRYMKNKDGNLVTCDSTDNYLWEISVNEGDIVQLWGDGSHVIEGLHVDDEGPLWIGCNYKQPCYVYGNVMSLLDAVNYPTLKNIAKGNAFTRLFEGSYIINHPTEKLELPATTLAQRCYYRMFYDTSLTIAPELPAKQLASFCYENMFSNSSLTTAPELPAKDLFEGCYAGMFSECNSLSTAPSKLPATILSPYCYSGMFWGCYNLETAPEMLVMVVEPYCCSEMFKNCGGLQDITKVNLSAKTLQMSCYDGMFSYTAIKESPVLPATTLVQNCYRQMFYDCHDLKQVTCLATDNSATDCTKDWLKITDQDILAAGRPKGTLFRAANVTWTNSDSGYPEGWSLADYVAP